MKKKIIEKVNKANLCLGCGICETVFQDKVSVTLNERGKYKVQNTKEYNKVDDDKFKEICPIIKPGNCSMDFWGEYIGGYFGFSNDNQIRYSASSGGILSQTLIYLLEAKEIDAVIHIGASEEDPLCNMAYISVSKEDILNRTGSRYAPAKLLKQLEANISKFSKYALVGKPCDIRAFRNAVSFVRGGEKIIYTFAFFCAGVPSKNATYAILDKFKIKAENIVKFDYRGNGWPGFATAYTKENKEYRMAYSEAWGEILGRDIHRYCKFCMDGLGEVADFCCGDGWYETKNGYPDFSEREGRNIILSRTLKGDLLLQKMKKEKKISLTKIDKVEVVLKYIQVGQYYRKSTLLGRVLAMRVCGKYLPGFEIRKLWKWKEDKSLMHEIKTAIGAIKRIIMGRL